MTHFITIQTFSERVGITKSAIRYYESKGLLGSIERNESGYRVYREEQVETVRLISSLRLADVSLEDIKMYLEEDNETNRQRMMDDWIHMIKTRQEVLNASLRYLESYSMNDQIYLVEKDREKIIWFSATSEIGRFKDHFTERVEELTKSKIPIQNSYLKYISGIDVIQAMIGFSVPADLDVSLVAGVEHVEETAPTMCIAMPYKDSIENIQTGYENIFNYAITHDWLPTGPLLEWYRGNDLTNLDLLMPVTRIVGRRNW